MSISKKILYISGTLTVVGLTVALLFIFVFGNNGSTAGEIVLSPGEYDLGNVPYGGGIVTREFKLENRGESPLKINSIKTSCGCTEAQLIYNRGESKKFGMNPNNLVWSQTIGSGEQATLKVFYDPAAHGPEGVGPFRRKIWITSTDSSNEEAEVSIEGTVIG